MWFWQRKKPESTPDVSKLAAEVVRLRERVQQARIDALESALGRARSEGDDWKRLFLEERANFQRAIAAINAPRTIDLDPDAGDPPSIGEADQFVTQERRAHREPVVRKADAMEPVAIEDDDVQPPARVAD